MELVKAAEKEQVQIQINHLLKKCLSVVSFEWIMEKYAQVSNEEGSLQLNMTFAQISRQVNKAAISADAPELAAINSLCPGVESRYWSNATIARIGLLLQLDLQDEAQYISKIKSLFQAAEMNELVALYAALPFLSYPGQWIAPCEEGIRTNIAPVLEAILYGNPYPAAFLPEASWNQLVLKAFFTEKEVIKIWHLQERNNAALQATLQDYIAERKAAGRSLPEGIFSLLESRNPIQI